VPAVEGDAAVTTPRAADERVKAAFQALGASAEPECSPQEIERIWQAVAGELPAEERRELVERLATNPACAEAWRVAHEVWTVSRGDVAVEAERRERTWTPSRLAAAAVVFVGIGIAIVTQIDRDSGDTFRDPNRSAVESLIPAEAALPRDAFRLSWTPGPEGSRYDVRVTTDDLQVLESVSGLTTPELLVDDAVLSSVARGARVLWQVDVTLPGGERVSSQTFVVRVQ
jgi:hypothetical protein